MTFLFEGFEMFQRRKRLAANDSYLSGIER